MNCKICGMELEEDKTVCPSCGTDNALIEEQEAEAPKKEKKKWSKKQKTALILSIVAAVLVVAMIATPIVWLTTRKTYQVPQWLAEMSHDLTVATMGDYKLTNGQMQVFYWMQVYDLVDYYTEQYGEYATYYLGLDVTKPLNEQVKDTKTGMTWEEYFVKDALYAWHRYQALVDEAKSVGYQMPGEFKKYFAELEDSMKEAAKKDGYESVDAMLQESLGPNVTFEDYYNYLEIYYIAKLYFAEVTSKLVYTDTELEAYFEENKEALAQYGITKDSGNLVDLRNILVMPMTSKDEDGNTVITDDAWENCLSKAQTILDTWKAGDKTEDSFAALAERKSEDESNYENGGLMEYVGKNDWVEVDVRHILITPEGGKKSEDGTTITYSEKEWEDCCKAAQTLLDEYLAGEKTEERFGDLANKHSDDNDGAVTNGGLYEDVYRGEMVAAFDEWIFDDSRVPGETGLVKTEFGYHVMYFVHRDGEADKWLFDEDRAGGDTTIVKTDIGYQILFFVKAQVAWKAYCQEGLLNAQSEELMQSYADAREIVTRDWAIMFGGQPAMEG